MNDDQQGEARTHTRERDGWVELFPFALFAVTIVSTIVAIALT